MKRIILLACASFVVGWLPLPVQAGSIWNDSIGDHQWGNTANWSSGVPNSGTTVTFNNTSDGSIPCQISLATADGARISQAANSTNGHTVVIGAAAAQDAVLTLSGSATELIVNGNATYAMTMDGTPNGSGYKLKLSIAVTKPMSATGPINVSADISGAAGINKTSAGTLTLSGNNSYLGVTTVDAGTLLVNNTAGSGTSSGTVLVHTTGKLGGTGTIAGVTTIQDGTLTPGTSAGTLTFGSDLSLNSASLLAYQLTGTDTTPGGANNDLAVVGGTLVLDGTLNVTDLGGSSFLSANAGDKWRLLNYTGGLTDNGLLLGTMPGLAAGLSFQVDTGTPGEVDLRVISVPEPSVFALLGGFGLMAVLRRRRLA